MRVHVLGASGSGTSTLGAALAARLGVPHIETDDIYWIATDPPFTTPRPIAERRVLLLERAPIESAWVLAGSGINWTEALEPHFDLIVRLTLDPALRMARLHARETARYGTRIEAGGDMAVASAAFLDWAEAYDSAGPSQRSHASHEAWLTRQTAPVLRLDSAAPVETLVAAVIARLQP